MVRRLAAGAFEGIAELKVVLVRIHLNVANPGVGGLAFGDFSPLHYDVRRTSEVGYGIARLPQLGAKEILCCLFRKKYIDSQKFPRWTKNLTWGKETGT